MRDQYSKPALEVLGELRDLTAASAGGPISDLVHGIVQRVGGILDGS
ncbi:MAG: lasso RiPP family leader peptide-containing protein [Pseudonocardiaceae bacterium]